MSADAQAGYSPLHPHEPDVAPVLDSEGRCLVCAIAVLEERQQQQDEEIERLTRERDEALGVREGLISPVQKVIEERRRAEAAERERDNLERAYRQACTNLATIRPDMSREFSIGETADLYYDALLAGWGGIEGYDPGRSADEEAGIPGPCDEHPIKEWGG
jgi:hypothetical protein